MRKLFSRLQQKKSRPHSVSCGEQRWCSGDSARLPLMLPGFKSWRRHYMRVEFVVGSLPYSERFSPVTPVFPSPQKPTFANSNSTRNQAEEELLCGCAISKSLFIYLFTYSVVCRFRIRVAQTGIRFSV